MYKRKIKYEDYNGNEVEEEYRFNINTADFIEIDATAGPGGISNYITGLIHRRDTANLYKFIKKLIVMSIGELSPDGRRFIKTDEIRNEFLQSEAYSVLLAELMSSDEEATEFFNGIFKGVKNLKSDGAPVTQTVDTSKMQVVQADAVVK